MPTNQETLDQNRKNLEAQNKAAMERADSPRPTPTQEEIDKAKLNLLTLDDLDSKADHGAPEEKSIEAAAAGEYNTRATRARPAAKPAE